MKNKYIIAIISLLLLMLVIFTGCDAYSPAVVRDTPAINVNTSASDTLVAGTINAIGGTVVLKLSGHKSCSVTVSGVWTGTLVVESSTDNQVTWVRSWLQSISATSSFELLQAVNQITANGAFSIFSVAGITHYRVRALTAMTGTANVQLTATEVAPPIYSSSSMIQNVVVDPNNSSTANLTAGATFTGIATTTLGVAGIQLSLKTDVDCTVYIEQSPRDAGVAYWDISDSFNYIHSLGGNSWTVQAVSSYLRVRVKNISSANSTYFRLQMCLCPIVEAIPRSLSPDGRLKTETTIKDQFGFTSLDTPQGEIRVIEPVKLVGATFIGTTLDANFWQKNLVGSGNVTQGNGNMFLTTGVTANSASYISSVRRGRYIAGSSLRYRAVIMQDAGVANNQRRWGVANWSVLPTITDGAYFTLNGKTFSIATRSATLGETKVDSGSFNGLYGTVYTLDTNYHVYEIYWTNLKVYFVVDGQILHTVTCTNTDWTDTPTLFIWNDNVNSNGLAVNITHTVKSSSIYRLGKFESAPIYKHINTNATYILKYGAGTLHSIIINTPTNSTISVYDNTSVVIASLIAFISLGNNTTPIELHYDTDFYAGLTVVTSGSADITITYE